MGIYEAGAVVNLLRYELSGKFSDVAGEFLSPAPLLVRESFGSTSFTILLSTMYI